MNRNLIILLVIVLSYLPTYGQKVGLVLSGGGADALAHIGVIKSLEENNVKVDYITGTSMGALIGALYAAGMPIEQIEAFFTSKQFIKGSQGQLQEKFKYYFPTQEPTPTIIPIRFKKTDNGYNPLFPSQAIPFESFDMTIVKFLAQAEKEAGYDFDNLPIPFRCVAADVVTKQLRVFKSGSLTLALRASMSYPFYVNPIEIDGHLMFDGGVYNNFPADIMCQEFHPDFIVGSNVSQNRPNPAEDDLFQQLQSIVMRPTDYSVDCGEGEMIEPQTNVGVFNFDHPERIIDSGYVEAQRHMQHILYHVKQDSSKTLPAANSFQPDSIIIGDVIFEGINAKQAVYAGSVLRRMRKKDPHLTMEKFERNYFRLYQGSYIEHVYPRLQYNPETKKYDAIVRVTPIKSLTLNVGGNVASRPISEGYLGLTYNNLSTYGFKLGASMTYGRLYQAGHAFARFDFATKLPLYIKPKITLHNWNWFESRQANLFVTDKPNYVIEGELFTGIELGVGLGNAFRLTGEVSYLQQESNYYQTKNFTPSDTSDATQFNGLLMKATLSSNSLNRIQYPYAGRKFVAKASYVTGNEFYTPGTTSPVEDDSRTSHSFIQLNVEFQNYISLGQKLKWGINLTGALSSMSFFRNYTSTVIQAPYYKPTPDSRTLFLESFHANKFGAVGTQFVFIPIKKVQLRAEGYIFQPYRSYVQDDQGNVAYGSEFADRFAIVSGVAVWETPFGPLSFAVNYYYNNPDISPEEEAPLTVLFNFGYILFNERAYH